MEDLNSVAESAEGGEPAARNQAEASALEVERDRLRAEKADLEDRLLRHAADHENFRRRVDRDRAEMLAFAGMDSVRALLPVLDDFERALKVECADREYAKGMELIYQRMIDALQKLGLEPIAAAGEQFDPHRHHAVEMVPTEEAADQSILGEFQRGYNFRGRLLRPAMVKVAVKPDSRS